MEKYQFVERSIIKKYRREIWKRFISAVNDYQLVQEGDKIAVCLSGGKDSMLMAKCMQELQRHGKKHFDLVFLVMDPGYSTINRQKIQENASLLNIPIKIFNTQIYNIVANIDDSPCYLCARMRRGHLYNNAQALGCNKIALGHHFDDVIETVLMNMMYAGEIKTMMPKLHSSNFKGMELIRPMYMVREEDILAWKKYHDLCFIQCACPLTQNCAFEENNGTSKRQEMKALIHKLRILDPNIDKNIFTSVHNINIDAIIGYRLKGERKNFLDHY
ncbi:MAG: tRNA 2-thiocytidine biosynthesis TtcA family protein [Eubacteriales bacterium]